MPGRKLPNFEQYRTSLELYAEVCQLTLEYKDEVDKGEYIPARRTIRVHPCLRQSTEIAVMLHEFGHVLDFADLKTSSHNRRECAYRAFYNRKPTLKQRDIVIECEKRAWENGRKIAKNLGIRLGKWYDWEQAAAMATYRGIETQNR